MSCARSALDSTALAAEFDQEVVEHALVVTKDDEWHGIMLSACPNQRLLDVIASVRGVFHRYESLLVPNDVMIERVAAEHAEIAAPSRRRRRGRAHPSP